MRILGIDPGSVVAGFGLIESAAGGLVHVAHGTLRPPRGIDLSARLAFLSAGLRDVLERYQPELAVVERVFVAASPRSALVLGQARGALLAVIGEAALPVHELAPRAIKQAVTGTGAASKQQIQRTVAQLLALESRPGSDAADALAAAICQANASRLATLRAGTESRRRAGRRWTRAPVSRAKPGARL